MRVERTKIILRGAVQGVGFRPFVYRLATELQLNGWVLNSAQGVFIEVEGERAVLERFVLALEKTKPPRAVIQSMEVSFLDALGYESFEIRESSDRGKKGVFILPDIATCVDCLREILDANDRRCRYPFTNCTNCGPRFSIIESLPYDRCNTSMKNFALCAPCEREYHDPTNRRFHAQPTACPRCGPQAEFWDASGAVLSRRDEALLAAAEVVRAGKILALKGIGGFQLIVDARNEDVVVRLRARKHREEKPFALMYPSLDCVMEDCQVSELEKRLLLAPESPIVLLRRKKASGRLASAIAPANPNLGVMLPNTPLHHLFVRELGFPVVATSGNLSDEPICIDEQEALARLQGIADFFLVHDRPIVRHVDDSIVRMMCGRELVLRRARGYAPLPVHMERPLPTVLAVGAHLKNNVALSVGTEVFISQHIGDLETSEAYSAFRKVAADLPRLYDVSPEIVACDLHPDYLSTKYAVGLGSAGFQLAASGILPGALRAESSQQDAAKGGQDARAPRSICKVQHHWAHVLSCMAENELDPPVLGVSWDGTGYGSDGTIWGGEFLVANGESFERVAHFRRFRLPGGEAAIREPRRTALGVLYEMWGAKMFGRRQLAPMQSFSASELPVIQQLLAKRINAPITSSAGRLFDAVASILDLRQRVSFEGQAAMELEFAIEQEGDEMYRFQISAESPRIVDWQPMFEEIVSDYQHGRSVGDISTKFHNTLAEIVVAVAKKIGAEKVVLTGGCFQNQYLTERSVRRLRESGLRPSWHQRVPPNDGGIALGQIMAACGSKREGVAKRGQ